MFLKTLANLIYVVKFQKVPMILMEEKIILCVLPQFAYFSCYYLHFCFNMIKKRERKIPKPNLEIVIFPKTLKFKIKFQIFNFI